MVCVVPAVNCWVRPALTLNWLKVLDPEINTTQFQVEAFQKLLKVSPPHEKVTVQETPLVILTVEVQALNVNPVTVAKLIARAADD